MFPNGLPHAAPFAGSKKPEPPELVRISALVRSIQITVQDTGEGLTEDQLRLLFCEGVQFDANKLQAGGGSGLGLCITKEIVQQHGGTIAVSSAGRGTGSTFTVELPLFEVPLERDSLNKTEKDDGTEKMDAGNNENNTAEKRTSQVRLTTAHSMTQRHHVLVVDDVVSNRKMLVRLLERRGHTCVTAKNGKEALDAFTANKALVESGNGNEVLFDTILMDFEMPIMDGPEATRRIKAQG